MGSSDSEKPTEKPTVAKPRIRIYKNGKKFSIHTGNRLLVLTEQHAIVKMYLEIDEALKKDS